MLLELRDAINGLADISAASTAAVAANPDCCFGHQNALLRTCDLTPCPLRGWTDEQDAEPCSWAGVTCDGAGRVTRL